MYTPDTRQQGEFNEHEVLFLSCYLPLHWVHIAFAARNTCWTQSHSQIVFTYNHLWVSTTTSYVQRLLTVEIMIGRSGARRIPGFGIVPRSYKTMHSRAWDSATPRHFMDRRLLLGPMSILWVYHLGHHLSIEVIGEKLLFVNERLDSLTIG